jgi:hypothetical protein
MKAKLLHDKDGLRTFAIVFDKGDEVRKQLLEFANTNRFADAHLTAIGACSEVKLGFFDRQQRPTKRSPSTNKLRSFRLAATLCRRTASQLCMRTWSSASQMGPRTEAISLRAESGRRWK